MQKKTRKTGSFTFRVKMGDYEVEVTGAYEQVLDTMKALPSLISDIDKAFEKVKPKKVATLTVKTGAPNAERPPSQRYPQISHTAKLDEALLKVLETDWGKWRPRTIDELSEALRANELEHSERTLAAVLMELVKKVKIRRWSTNTGYVYILAEKEALRSRGDAE
ncbi:MAG: hypothetical protein ABSD73_10265 [Candidatus Bathyarchaeia archaeon]